MIASSERAWGPSAFGPPQRCLAAERLLSIPRDMLLSANQPLVRDQAPPVPTTTPLPLCSPSALCPCKPRPLTSILVPARSGLCFSFPRTTFSLVLALRSRSLPKATWRSIPATRPNTSGMAHPPHNNRRGTKTEPHGDSVCTQRGRSFLKPAPRTRPHLKLQVVGLCGTGGRRGEVSWQGTGCPLASQRFLLVSVHSVFECKDVVGREVVGRGSGHRCAVG